MKLRNLLLTAALFLTAGIASAAVTYDDTFDYSGDEPVKVGQNVYYEIPDSAYYLHESKNPNEEGFRGDTYGKISVYLSSEGSSNLKYKLMGEFNRDIMTFDLEEGYNEIILPTYYYGQVGQINRLMVVTDYNLSAPLSTSFSGYDAAPTLFYAAGRNTIGYNDGSNTATVTFGSPLPTPVITLLIALGFGAAFVMYRNRKQVKA